MKKRNLENKVAIITGASSGIGKATARLFAAEGAQVFLVARNEEILKEECSLIRQQGGKAAYLSADLRDISKLSNVIEAVLQEFNKIDILVNGAGVIASGTIKNTTIEDWEKMFALNVTAVFALSQLCIPEIIKNKGNINIE